MTLTMERQKLRDLSGKHYTVEIIRSHGRYEIRLDGDFYATAETMSEAEDEISDIARIYNLM